MKIKAMLFMAMLLLTTGSLIAQVTTSGINGKITGANNESLPGATVIALHVPSGTQYGTTTNNDGFFRITNMRTGGPYKVTISFVGYKTQEQDGIYLSLGQTLALNITLQESSSQLTGIEVISQRNAIIDGNRTGASTNVRTEQIESLPSINRSITDFTRLTPQASGSSFAGRDGRYNNITIDGANFNNNFGLSSKSLPGGDAQPISLDAIDEISVNVAPFDIRQSNFTGANINAVTRSGDNTWKGSMYTYYRDKNFNGKKIEDKELELSEQSTTASGLRFGGPLVKNKLFIFANAETEATSYPGVNWSASSNGVGDAENFISRTSISDLQTMHDYLLTRYGYEAGYYANFPNFTSSNIKALARLDWNINKHHRFTTRYNWVRSTNDQLVNATSSPGTRSTFGRIGEMSMAFSNANYGFLNTVSSVTAELNSIWTKTANKLLVTYTKIQDTRNSKSTLFPFVDIYKDGDPYMSFGYELFSKDNDVRNNVLTFTDNFNIYLGEHTITLGASFDYLYFGNSYKRYGTSYYRFKSMEDFMNGAAPTTFGLTYPYGDGDGYARLNFGYGAAYIQDEYQLADNFKLTAGVRVEMPAYFDDLTKNDAISKLKFQDLNGDSLHIDVGSWPESKPTYSPRLGFNWDVKGDKSLQVRGGTGIFTGRLPFVWFTNQPTNSGVLQNTVDITKAYQLTALRFNPDPFAHLSIDSLFSATPSSKAPGSIAVVDKNFKMPQVWRNNLAIDLKLPFQDMVLTLEGIYSKDMNGLIQYNANLKDTDTTFIGADNRQRWLPNKNRINSSVSSAMVLTNTDENGFAYSVTAQLTKPFTKGFSGFVAYTYSGAKDLTANPGSAAQSAWSSNPAVISQNDPGLSYSQFAVPHRVVGALTYHIEYAKRLGTTLSVYFSGSSQGRRDYIYSNDMNGDGNAADLMYIPKDESEIEFADLTYKDADGVSQTILAADQETAFWAYVEQDEYLKNNKGQYAERYGVVMPWLNRWDLKLLQDLYVSIDDSRRTIQLSVDLLNFGNLLNPNWGVAQKQALGAYDITLLKYAKANAEGVPTYTMNLVSNKLPTSTYVPILSTVSTWGAQVGLRFTF